MYAVVHFASLVRREAARANAPAVPTTGREIVLGSDSQAGAVAVRSGDVTLWRTKFSPRVLLAACLSLCGACAFYVSRAKASKTHRRRQDTAPISSWQYLLSE